jgi:chemotaxis protein histidine kinase CheA/ActR/RegA family two-component response regulator
MSTDHEHTDSLRAQVAELIDILMSMLASDETDTCDMATIAQGLERYMQQVERIAITAEAGEWMGLHNICVLYQATLAPLISNPDALSEQILMLLESWPSLVMSYLEAPGSPDTRSTLIEHLQDAAWMAPLQADEAEILKDILAEQVSETSILADAAPLDDGAWREDIFDTVAPMREEAIAGDLPTDPDGLAFDHRFEESDGLESSQVEVEAVDALFNRDDAEGLLASEGQETFAPYSPSESEARGMLDVEEEVAVRHDAETNECDTAARELLSLLSLEVSQFAESLEVLLMEEAAEDWRQILTEHLEDIERLGDGAEAAGLAGLQQACGHIATNVLHAAAQEEPLGDTQRQVIAGWPHVVLAYLENPYAHGTRTGLAQYLRDDRWLQPLSDDLEDALVESLGVIEANATEDSQEPRKRHAELDDIALTLPEDVNPALLDSLLQELPRQAADFTAAIQRLTTAAGSPADVAMAQRVAHTLKGAAHTVGVPGIANLTHYLEDILLALTQRQILPNAMLNETLINAADCLEMMNETLAGASDPPAPDTVLNVLQEVLDWANFLDTVSTLEADMRPESHALMPGIAETQTPQQTDTAPAQAPAASSPTRISADLIDDLLRLAGEAMILNGQLRDRLTRTLQQTRTIQVQHNHLQQLVFELEHLVDIRGLTSPLLHHAMEGGFDPLEMEQYNELHTVSHRLLEAVTDTRESTQEMESSLVTLGDALTAQQKVQQESEEAIMRTRMVPVKTIAPRLQRGIRQACRLTGKEAELVISGAETLIDGNVLNSMVDPLMHMLRNAVDHGLESPEQREQMGKAREGLIHLDFVREGNSILIRCRDDGAGLNYDAIRETALARGLIRDYQVLSEEELGRLILHPGFSTRAEATQVSGRGIGMDVVYTRIQELKGSLHLSSVANQGCQIELRLPVTLMSTHALLVRVGQDIFAVSDRGIAQILYPGAGEVGQVGHQTTYQLGHEIFEVKTLWDALHLRSPQLDEQLAHCPALLIREDSGRSLVMLVQEVVDSQTLVVKNLGRYIPELPGLVGATILGNGRVTPVLDLPELLSAPVRAARPMAQQENPARSVQRHVQNALVVDDSLSARRALAEFVADLGFDVQTASDGLEAVAILEQSLPDILLVDLEMPRMNGLELTSHVRSRDETRHLPVIMITSRSTEKHRQNADQAGVDRYLVKPFSEDDLAAHIEQLTSLHGAA